MPERDHHQHEAVATYVVKVQGQLSQRWSEWFDGWTITLAQDGTTTLLGPVMDQAALYGLISRIRDLGLTLLAVQRLDT